MRKSRLIVAVAVVSMLCSPLLSASLFGAVGQYCKTISEAKTNDTTACKKNANGTAGCTGDIKEYAKVGKCENPSWLAACLFSYDCTESEVAEYVEYLSVPESTWAGQIACLRSLGISALGVACIVGVVTGKVSAAIATWGASELASPLAVAVAVACGGVAGAAFNNWWNNPCCHTYCVPTGQGTPSTNKVTTC